ncbi:MAG: neutral/alkaline non-lysosomal ceramidase N-terminal domain-containing protein [Fermentimonas sp.]
MRAESNITNTENSSSEKIFKAGAATSNITPFIGGKIVGGFNPIESNNVHDDLHARCLILDDGNTKLVFIIVDLIALRRNLTEEIKTLVSTETGIPRENVLISAVHTHSATNARGEEYGGRRQWDESANLFDDYQKFVIRRCADAVKIALNNLEPAQIGWGAGEVPEHVFVRRWKMKQPVVNPFGEYEQVMMNPGYTNPNLLEPAGKTDPEVSFIYVRSTKGKPIALLANYSLHYVGGVPGRDISADYFAVFADRIQELLKADRQDPPFVGIMSNGTSGNVNNNNYAKPAEKNAPYAKMRRVADDVAREVFRVCNKIQFHDWVSLQATTAEIPINIRKPDKELIEWAKNTLKKDDNVKPIHRLEKPYANRVLSRVDWPDQVNIVLQAFRVGDLGIAAIPFETFTDTGLAIKAKSALKPTFVIELANGCYGYLPTPEQHELGGYETWLGTCNVQKDASVIIESKLLDMLEKLK